MPPLVGVAVNVTDEPAQVGLVPAVLAIATDGVAVGVTVMVMPVLAAVAGLAQEALDVSTHVTICPVVKVVVV